MLEQICYTPEEQIFDVFLMILDVIGAYCCYCEAVFVQKRRQRRWLAFALVFTWFAWIVVRIQRRNDAHPTITGNHSSN